MPKTLVLIADGSEEMEAVITIDVLRRAGWPVTVAAAKEQPTIMASRGVKIQADICLHELDASSYPLIVLPGGKGGTEVFSTNVAVQTLLQQFHATGKTIAAICAAPLALDAAGILEGRQYTCYPGVNADISAGHYHNSRVVEDGNLITSQGPGTTFAFALALVAHFETKKAADELRRQMVLT